jgi:chromosome segregation ATPase
VTDLNEKLNTLQTNLETTKTDLSHMHKQTKQFNNDKGILEKEIDFIKKKIKQKEDYIDDALMDINKIKDTIRQKEADSAKVEQEV